MAVTVRFVNGLQEIGGTFVEVESVHAKCMFDFGFAHPERMDVKVAQRRGYAAADLASIGCLPRTDGIYDARNAEALRVKAYGDFSVTKEHFILVSHMHIDHMGGLPYLHPDVPVYMTKDSLKLYQRLAANEKVLGGAHKNCIGVTPGIPFKVGDITVTPVSVDHDVPGACGFLIEVQGKIICYTGDFRFHGFHREVSREFAHYAASAAVDLLICEGTMVSFEDVDMRAITAPEEGKRTEQDLLGELTERAEGTDGLLVANFYPRNVERMHQLLHTLQRAGRKLVLSDTACDYLSAFYPDDPVCVYQETVRRKNLPSEWKKVGRRDLLSDPAGYVLYLPYRDFYEIISLKDVVTTYLHFDGTPLGDFDASYASLLSMLEALDIPYERLGVSGHAEPYYLRYMIDTIAPRILVPLHSFRPEQVVSDKAGRRILPQDGETITL